MAYTKADIKTLLDTRNDAVERGIVRIYGLQTAEEQITEATIEHNGVGFSGADSRLGSYYAKWVMGGNHLSGKHLERARKMAKKYSGQLVRIANHEL